MGRVARYKKVKTPGQQKESLPEAPKSNAKDHHVPRKQRLMFKMMERMQNGGAGGGKRKEGGLDNGEDGQGSQKKSKKGKRNQGDALAAAGGGTKGEEQEKMEDMKLKPNETLKAFSRRVDGVAAGSIRGVIFSKTNKAAKQRARREKVKEKKRQHLAAAADRGMEQEEDLLFKSDRPRFGEVAQEPPRLQFKPRRPEKEMHRTPLLLQAQLAKAKQTGSGQGKHKQSPMQRKAMEAERARAIEAYRANKLAKAGEVQKS